MHHKVRLPHVHFSASLRPDSATLAILVLLLFLLFVFLFLTLTAPPAQAQTYNVIHNFTGGLDGSAPNAGLTVDRAGNLYGTTANGGAGFGTVFRLSNKSSGWVFTPLYVFRTDDDGNQPFGKVTFGPDGSLYGTTLTGGGAGCGIVFKLTSPTQVSPNAMGGWSETRLYRFTGSGDGCGPSGDLVFDQTGSIYGTTVYGGINLDCDGGNGCGTVFKLTPSGGGWTESLLYSFNLDDGAEPWYSGVIFDGSGNLYGTTVYGGRGGCEYGPCGNAFQLTPSGSGWTQNVVHNFQGGSDGAQPVGGLVSDQHGYLYGTTAAHGARGGGTVFETWQGQGWEFQVLYSFAGGEFEGPYASLFVDAAGNLYGTTYQEGAYRLGSAFKLTRGCAGFSYTSLHDFAGGQDGAYPISSLVLDANGNIFGTTSAGGAYGQGVVFEITPAAGSKITPADSSECSKGQ